MQPTHDAYLEPYREAQRAHGHSFDVTLWGSPHTQRKRFEVFTEMVFLPGKRILDAGCSRGDFAAYLLERGVMYEHFVGVDGLPEVVAYANGRKLERADFHAGDFVRDTALLRLGDPQVVAISGTLNTMDVNTVLKLLDHAWDAAGQSLVFNFLSDTCGDTAPPQEYPAHRLPTLVLLDWAFDQAWDVRFRQDYMPGGHDATIAMTKH